MTRVAADPMDDSRQAGSPGTLLGAMILAELLRRKHEGLNRGNGDPPIVV